MYVVLGLVVALIGCLVIYWKVNTWKQEQQMKGSMKIGQVPFFQTLKIVFRKDLHIVMLEFMRIYGDMFYINLFGRHLLVVANPTVIQQCKSLPKPEGSQKSYQYVAPYGLLSMQDERWKHHRALMTPVFSSSAMKRIFPVIQKKAEFFLQKLSDIPSERRMRNIHSDMTRFTLDTILESAFGFQMKLLDDLDQMDPARLQAHQELKESFDLAFEWIAHIQTSPIKYWKFFPTPNYRKFINSAFSIQSFLIEIIQNRIEYRKTHDDQENLLDLLLDASDGEQFSPEELRDELVTIAAAGFETTNNALGFLCFLLSKHPKIQQRVQEEIDLVRSQSESGSLDFECLKNLRFLTSCIKESMRIYPSVPMTSRFAEDSLSLQINDNDKLITPKHTTVIMFMGGLNRNGNYWTNPDSFLPDRWLDDVMDPSAKKNPYLFIPWSVGSKTCLGFRFAMMEMQIVMANLLSTFSIQPDPTFELVQHWSLTAFPKDHNISVHLVPRK